MLNTKGATAKNGVLSSLYLWSAQFLEYKNRSLATALELSYPMLYHETFLDFCPTAQ